MSSTSPCAGHDITLSARAPRSAAGSLVATVNNPLAARLARRQARPRHRLVPRHRRRHRRVLRRGRRERRRSTTATRGPRARSSSTEIEEPGGTAIAVGADLTDPESVAAMIDDGRRDASGGSTSSYSTPPAAWRRAWARTTRCASTVMPRSTCSQAALPLLEAGSRVVFVTSHQAHFIRTVPTMPEYVPVALQQARRRGCPARADPASSSERGIGFVVVSGDMIEGTITATLLERANPGAIELAQGGRRDASTTWASSPRRWRSPRSSPSRRTTPGYVGDVATSPRR